MEKTAISMPAPAPAAPLFERCPMCHCDGRHEAEVRALTAERDAALALVREAEQRAANLAQELILRAALAKKGGGA